MALTFLRGFIGILKSTSLALIISGWMDGWLYLKIKINLRVAPSEALKSHLLSMGA